MVSGKQDTMAIAAFSDLVSTTMTPVLLNRRLLGVFVHSAGGHVEREQCKCLLDWTGCLRTVTFHQTGYLRLVAQALMHAMVFQNDSTRVKQSA